MNKFIHIPKEFDFEKPQREVCINVSQIVCVSRRGAAISVRLGNDYEYFDIKAWKYFAEALGESEPEEESNHLGMTLEEVNDIIK